MAITGSFALNSFTTVESPIGRLLLVADGESLTGLFMDPKEGPTPGVDGAVDDAGCAPLSRAVTQLAEYFGGLRREFELPLRLEGTKFQRQVWTALMEIPYGATSSYGQLAQRVGNPQAARAVGLANGRNPLSIFIPCHRVIGADGSLTGYGGGLARKRWLLAHEGLHSPLMVSGRADLGAQCPTREYPARAVDPAGSR